MTDGHTPERWQQIEELLSAALEREPAARDAYLHAACPNDEELRREVASLLAAHERTGAVDLLGANVARLTSRLGQPDTTSSASLDGRVIGRYHVLGRIGGGGMGVVYKAHDERLGRTVALKFLQPHLIADTTATERFRLEARTVAALEHPNICTIHEIGDTDDGQLYLAMPLYDGETLQERMAAGPLPIGDAVNFAVQILRGLAKAHARGIIHRDIKPSNVLVTGDGVVKLLDFGIAKLADVTLTGAAGPIGTMAYMSPDQAIGHPADLRGDIWSVGVVLFEMLTGQRPYPSGVAAAISEKPDADVGAALTKLRPDVPLSLVRIVQKAVTKAAEQRYDSALSFERELLALGLGSSTSHATDRPATPTSVSFTSRWLTRGAAMIALAGLAGAAWWLMSNRTTGAGSAASAVANGTLSTLAVLPFTNRSQDRDQEYFSDGITEELITTLSRVEGLRVTSSTTAFAYKDRSEDLRSVGRKLDVAAVLEGSVRRVGSQLRITASLVDVANGYQLWSETYDRDAGDALAIQEEIAAAIATKLRGKLVGARIDSSAADKPGAAAYDLYLKGRHSLYLKGRYAWASRTEQGVRGALKAFTDAIAAAPTYAPAHAGLADAYAILGFYDYMPPTDAFPMAEAAAKRAVALDPTLAAPHATLGYVALYYHWDMQRGEAEFKRAIALDPNYATAHQWYANLLTTVGRYPEAVREMRRAEELDPLSLIAKAALGWVMYHADENTAALEQFRQTLELNDTYAVAYVWRGWALQEMDSLNAAIASHRKALSLADSGGLYVASLARSLALAGQRTEAAALLQRLEARSTRGLYVPSYEVAKVHEALDNTDQAFAWLEKARAQRSHSIVFLKVDPQLARMRSDPRFAKLVAQVYAN